MATLYPFRALRPNAASASRIAAVPYDVVSTEEAAALAAGNPLSFLRVSRAEIELPPGSDPYEDAVYNKAASNFSELRHEAMNEDELRGVEKIAAKIGSDDFVRRVSSARFTDQARAIIDEQSKTFVDYAHKFYLHEVPGTGEIIWLSERDGWNHLYLYDRKTAEWSVDPELGPIVVEIFKRVSEGETCEAIARDLQARGVPRAKGTPES